MRIKYNVRSEFAKGIGQTIHQNQDGLLEGSPITLILSSRGYKGDIHIAISANDRDTFFADWEQSDPSRFPARIKAAASALRELGIFGQFKISHDTGTLTIRRVYPSGSRSAPPAKPEPAHESEQVPQQSLGPRLPQGQSEIKTVVLISCASKKLPHEAPARDLYTSPLFRYNLAYAQTLDPDHIFILSAKYGLLSPDTVIEPYDLTLNNLRAAGIRQWANDVLGQLRKEADPDRDHFIFLAGEKYRRYLLPHLSSYDVPMKGLPIGKQLQYLKARVGQ
jgi:hypothetical protein